MPEPLYQLAASALDDRPMFAWFVPGRIEVLGKHTDYCGGRSLLCATKLGFAFAACATTEPGLTVIADGKLLESDNLYVRTVHDRLRRNFAMPTHGARISFASNLPAAAGLSSSSALIVGLALVLADLYDLRRSPHWEANIRSTEDLAGYLGCVENGQSFGTLAGDAGVGTFGGSQDHTAILCSRPGRLVQYGFSPVRFEAEVAMPSGYVFVVIDSGVVAEKTGEAKAKYNALSSTVQEILAIWNQSTSRDDRTLAAAVRSEPSAYSTLSKLFPPSGPRLRNRLCQFICESEFTVERVVKALAAEDLNELNRWSHFSHAIGELNLRNQVAETTFLAAEARRLGAVAASAFGAGFGGSVWAIIQASKSDEFSAALLDKYQRHFRHRRATIFATPPAPPASRIYL